MNYRVTVSLLTVALALTPLFAQTEHSGPSTPVALRPQIPVCRQQWRS